MNLPIREIVRAARRMGASVFKINGQDVYFKFNGIYRQVSLEVIMEYAR